MKKFDKFSKNLALTLLFFGAFHASATTQYSPSELTQLTHTWLESQLEPGEKAQVSPLDSRLGNKSCDRELQWKRLGSTQQSTIQLSCASPSWQLFVSSKVTQTATVVMSVKNIPAGSILSEEMLEINETEVRLNRGTLIISPASVLGARVKRSLSAGQAITQQDLCLVCKGDVVTIVGSHGTLQVHTRGVAQHDAVLGQQVAVTNQHSQKTVYGEVVAVKKVAIAL